MKVARPLRLGSALLLLAPLAQAGEKDLRDLVITQDGREHRGRVIERFGEEELVLYEGTRKREIPQEDVQTVVATRDRLASWIAGHVQGLPPEKEWALVEQAEELALPEMARLQAYQTLLADPEHAGAHEYLGHQRGPRGYRWPAGKRWVSREEHAEHIREWPDRFVLESEHWVVETNTSVEQAVQCLFDLELLYLRWMDELAEDLDAGEDVLEKDELKMTMHVFAARDDEGYTSFYNSEREPHYDPSRQVMTARGNPNLSFTFYEGSSPRPVDFFDVAVQQLMYSTLVLSRRSGFLPVDILTRNAHWVELGMGYWLGRQLTGSPGYARPIEFHPEPRNERLARELLRTGPLSRRRVRKEITNLIGLELRAFHALDDDGHSRIYRAKARSLFRYLMEENPPAVKRGQVVGYGREALFHYLRDAYVTPTSHSSSSFDEGLGGAKVEDLYDGWARWRMN